ncbi:MAG: M23 family metallopeptidase [Luteimonas sp.]
MILGGVASLITEQAQAQNWSVPLQRGARGSAWCVCRTSGTSPHIGQDWNASGAEIPVAIEDGNVQSTTFGSTCGVSLNYTDEYGSSWRYVHLNQGEGIPANGTRVVSGARIGTISRYPLTGCGNGAHLHLERRSAGFFRDSPASRSCEAGPEACNYNPNSPFPALANTQTELQSYEEPVNLTAAKTPQAGCKIPVADYPIETLNVGALSSGLTALVSAQPDRANGVNHLLASAALKGNDANSCGPAGCLADWSLYAEVGKGQYARVFFDNSVRGQKLQRVAEEQFCALTAASRYVVKATTLSGETLWQEAMVN